MVLSRILVGYWLRHSGLVPRGGQVVVVLRDGVKRRPSAAGLVAAGIEHGGGFDTWRRPIARGLVLVPGREQIGDIVLLRRFGTSAAPDLVGVVAVVLDLVEPDFRFVLRHSKWSV